MDDIDSLIDSMIGGRKTSEYLDEKYAKALKVKQTTTKGDGVFTLRSFSVQDTICSLPFPIIHGVDSEVISSTCSACLFATNLSPVNQTKGSTLKACSGCQFAHFCGRECQVHAWSAYHKYECKILKKSNKMPAIVRAVMRIVLLKQRGVLSNEQWLHIQSFSTHTPKGRSNVTEIAETIQILTASSMSVPDIEKLVFTMRSNGVEIPGGIYGRIGVMLDPLVAKVNHSCEPNIALYRPQDTMESGWNRSKGDFIQVIPLREIKEGEEIYNCYIAPTTAVDDRRAALRGQYFFDCDCSLCQSDTRAEKKIAKEPQCKNFEQMIGKIKLGKGASGLEKATKNLDAVVDYISLPELYASGKFPEVSMVLVQESLKLHRYDLALVNLLRLHFLVNHKRFIGRHNPTHLYTITLILDTLDVLLGLSPSEQDIQSSLRALEIRGLDKMWLQYWRSRFTQSLQQRLEKSAMKDLSIQKSGAEPISGSVPQQAEQASSELMCSLLKVDKSLWTGLKQEALD